MIVIEDKVWKRREEMFEDSRILLDPFSGVTFEESESESVYSAVRRASYMNDGIMRVNVYDVEEDEVRVYNPQDCEPVRSEAEAGEVDEEV